MAYAPGRVVSVDANADVKSSLLRGFVPGKISGESNRVGDDDDDDDGSPEFGFHDDVDVKSATEGGSSNPSIENISSNSGLAKQRIFSKDTLTINQRDERYII